MQEFKERGLVQVITQESKSPNSKRSKRRPNTNNDGDNVISSLEIYQIKMIFPSRLIDRTQELVYSHLAKLLRDFMDFEENQVFDYRSNSKGGIFSTQMPLKRTKTIYELVYLLSKERYKTNLDDVSRILEIM